MYSTKKLIRLAETGEPDAQCGLATRLAYGRVQSRNRDWKRIGHLMTAAAKQGHAHAQFFLAYCYLNGEGLKKDEAKGSIGVAKQLSWAG